MNPMGENQTDDSPIYFYSRTDEYGDFCNFSGHGFELDGKYWLSVEHYFQAQKFAGSEHEEAIRLSRTPKQAKALGRSTRYTLRPDWETVKDSVMLRAVRKKFETHIALQERLLSTGNRPIVENARGDYYWGCGADGSGLNRLGEILITVRDELRVRTAE